MAFNQVSDPPLTAKIVGQDGKITRAWSIWFRTLYTRTSDKRGNAIDEAATQAGEASETAQAVEEGLLTVNSSLSDTIEEVNENKTSIDDQGETINEHIESANAHGANGELVGNLNFSTEDVAGVLKALGVINNAIIISIAVTESDATAAPATYDQAHVETLVDLANNNKQVINDLVSDVGNLKNKINELIQALKDAGHMVS